VLLHGPSGLGKGIASDHAVDFVRAAVGEVLNEYPEDLTGEGLTRLMVTQTDAGENCVGLVYADEFGDLLGGQDYKAEFAKRLTRLYSSPDKMGVGRSKDGERWVKGVFLNILGCSQEHWLRTLPLHALKGGLFARILTIPEEKKRHWRYEPHVDSAFAHQLAADIKERVDAIGTGGLAGQTPGAAKLGEDWYLGEEERWKKLDAIVMPWCERRMDHAIKLAFLNSLLEGTNGPLLIDEEGMKWGIEVVEWLTPRVQEAFIKMDETKAGEIHRLVTEMVVRNGGMMDEKLIRAGLGHRYTARDMDGALAHLVLSGKVSRFQGQGARGEAAWLVKMIS
jgi:hypothetical protein